MQLFEFLMVLVSIVVGLGIAALMVVLILDITLINWMLGSE